MRTPIHTRRVPRVVTLIISAVVVAVCVASLAAASNLGPEPRSIAPSMCSGAMVPLHLNLSTPTSIPLDEVAAEAPLFPSARASRIVTDAAAIGASLVAGDTKTGKAEFTAPVGLRQLIRWYRRVFTACGFGPWDIAGRVGGERTIWSVVYHYPTIPELKVAVTLGRLGTKQSVIIYDAGAGTLAPRPSYSYLPRNLTRVRIVDAFKPELRASRPRGYALTLTGTALKTLAQIVDLPGTITDKTSCLPQDGAFPFPGLPYIRLTFIAKGGRRWVVTTAAPLPYGGEFCVRRMDPPSRTVSPGCSTDDCFGGQLALSQVADLYAKLHCATHHCVIGALPPARQ